MPNVKKHVKFFVSYSHHDAKQKVDLLARLDAFLCTSRSYDYSLWHDGNILLGEDWQQEIGEALKACDFGLLLVSPRFLTSKFVTAVELPRFVGERATKPVLPVALGRLVIERMDLKGLEAPQIFFHKEECFAQRTTDKTREDFAAALFVKIEERMDRFFGPAGTAHATRRARA